MIFPQGAGHDLLIDFMKDNRDTRLLSAFTKNEFNGAVIQAFLDQGKEIPPYIAENAIIEDGKFKGWTSRRTMGTLLRSPFKDWCWLGRE